MKAYQAVIRELDAAGIDTLFTLMAEDTLELLAELKQHWRDEIRLIEARHEQGAMAMADGYSRASDELGVCLVGRGPGIAQTGTSLVTARKNGSKLLVIVPESPIAARHDPKEFEQESYLRATAGTVLSTRSHDTLIDTLRDGIRQARGGTGPVIVQVPWDLLDADLPAAPDGSPPAQDPARLEPSPTMPTDDQIAAAVDAYLDADATVPPIILAGRGAVAADAREPLVSLAEQTGGLLATTLRARGYFADHPYAVGFVGEWGTDLANTVTIDSGCVFAVGCSLNPHTTDHGHVLRDDAKVIHIDTDPATFEKHTPVDVAVHGDARLAAEKLTIDLADHGINRADEFWTTARREHIAAQDPIGDGSFPDDPDRLDPRELVRELDQRLPDDRIVVTDGGHFTRWIVDGISTPSPREFIWTLDFAAIGQGLGAGIGAALATADRPTFVFCGDAGSMMAIQEVETAARYNLPLTIFILNDETLGSEYHNLAPTGGYAEAARLDAPAFSDVAHAFGAAGATVRDLADLDTLTPDLAARPEGPRVIDCKINHQVRHRSKN